MKTSIYIFLVDCLRVSSLLMCALGIKFDREYDKIIQIVCRALPVVM